MTSRRHAPGAVNEDDFSGLRTSRYNGERV